MRTPKPEYKVAYAMILLCILLSNSAWSQEVVSQSLFGGSDDFQRKLTSGEFITKCHSSNLVIIAGTTGEKDLPVTVDAQKKELGGLSDGWILVLDAEYKNIVYCSYFGGMGEDKISDAALIDDSILVIVGTTSSIDMPITEGAYQSMLAGGSDAYYARLNLMNQEISYCTFFGGTQSDMGTTICVDPNGAVFLGGDTFSDDLKVAGNVLQNDFSTPREKLSDGFIAVFDENDEFVVCTYYGGNRTDRMMDLAYSNNRIACGITTFSTDMRISAQNPVGNISGGWDAYWCFLSRDLDSLFYASYYGGESDDEVFSLSWIDDKCIVVGNTCSDEVYISLNAQQKKRNLGYVNGYSDLFVVIQDYMGNVEYASYMGGRSSDLGRSMDISGNSVLVVGNTWSVQELELQSASAIPPGGGPYGMVLRYDISSRQSEYFISPYAGPGTHIYDANIVKDTLYLVGMTASDTVFTTSDCNRSLRDGQFDVVLTTVTPIDISTSVYEREDGQNTINMSIYPNPANVMVNVVVDRDARIELRDVLGRMVRNGRTDWNGAVQLELSRLSPGVYYLSAQSKKGVKSKVLVVK